MSSRPTDRLANPYDLEVGTGPVSGDVLTSGRRSVALSSGVGRTLVAGLLGVGASVGLAAAGAATAFADDAGSASGSLAGGEPEGRSGSHEVPEFELAWEPGAERSGLSAQEAPDPAAVPELRSGGSGGDGKGGRDGIAPAVVAEGDRFVGGPGSFAEPAAEVLAREPDPDPADRDRGVGPAWSGPSAEEASGPVEVVEQEPWADGGGSEAVFGAVEPPTSAVPPPMPAVTSSSQGDVEWSPAVVVSEPGWSAAEVPSTPEVRDRDESVPSVLPPRGAGLLGSIGDDGAVASRYVVSPAVAPGGVRGVVDPGPVLDGDGVLVASSGVPGEAGLLLGDPGSSGAGTSASGAALQPLPTEYLVAREEGDGVTDDRWVNDLMHEGDPAGPGTSGYVVAQIQEALSTLSFDTGGHDGHFGPMTTRAVREFQRSRGLRVDGVVGRETARRLIRDSEARKARIREILRGVPEHWT